MATKKTTTSKKNGKYDAESIKVLEGLEPVRMRPGMYIGGTDSHGYHHLLREILDNSIDEVINGHAQNITVELDEDYRGVTIDDEKLLAELSPHLVPADLTELRRILDEQRSRRRFGA